MKPPGHRYSREELSNLKRSEIQRLCKDYGVRANMKTDALVELLLDSIHSNMSPLVRPPPQHQPQNVVRRVSTRSSSRTSSLRSRGTSGSSSSNSHFSRSTLGYGHSGNAFAGSSRANKSRDTQLRLGVGRPTAVGGSGARKGTRSSSMAHLRRGKNSRSLRLPEVVIQEEPEPVETQPATLPSQTTEHNLPLHIELNGTSPNLLAVPLNDALTAYGDSNVEQMLDSMKNLPSQVAWLQNSLQQRENDILNLHNELQLCKAELSELRGHITRVPVLESELRATKESLEKVYVSLHEWKGKGLRRVSVPLGENNTVTNSPRNNEDPPLPSSESATPRAHDAYAVPESIFPYVAMNTLGKRRQMDDQEDLLESSDKRENRLENRPRKAMRTVSRKVLQEKPVGSGRLLEKPTHGQESGEESVASSGTSSGPSTAPSIGTPPPPTHEPQCFNEANDVHPENSMFNFSFRQAASSTPRNEVFNYFEAAEPFSPGSAMKELTQRQDTTIGGHLAPPFEIRRISAAVARPQTPRRQIGPERFRIAAEQVPTTPAHEDVPPFDPYSDDLFGMQDVNGDYMNGNTTAQVQGYPSGPMTLGQLGLNTTVSAVPPESQTPVHKTVYGTEVQTDKRFGDFGRDGLGTSSNINFWAPFRMT